MIISLVEVDQGKVTELSLQMLTLGRRLASQLGIPLQALLIGEAAQPVFEHLSRYGVSTLYLAQHEGLESYAPEAWAQSLVQLIDSQQPQVVMAAGSEQGNEVMAHLAARSQLPLAANCTEIQPGEPYLVTRLRWGGSLLEEARLHGQVKLLTIAPQAVPDEPISTPETLTVSNFTPALTEKDFRVRVKRRVERAGDKVSLAEAKIVIGGGRGVGSAEGFQPLEELAGLLGGAVGCSRAVTSLGWRSHTDQIGQTGTRIAPDIYIACGVSGAIQHIVGAKGAKCLLAINTDPEAPIIARADYAIIGDLHEVIPALCREIRQKKG